MVPVHALFPRTFTRGREAMHITVASWFLEGQIALLMLSNPSWEFDLEKVLEKFQIGLRSGTFVPVHGHAQATDRLQDCVAGWGWVSHGATPSPWVATALMSSPTPCCTVGLCPSFSMFLLHQPSNPFYCFCYWKRKNYLKWRWGEETDKCPGQKAVENPC